MSIIFSIKHDEYRADIYNLSKRADITLFELIPKKKKFDNAKIGGAQSQSAATKVCCPAKFFAYYDTKYLVLCTLPPRTQNGKESCKIMQGSSQIKISSMPV